MDQRLRIKEIIMLECEMTSIRSSGPGGQHVNKTSSAIQIKFSILDSLGLTYEEKGKLLHRLKNKLVQDEVLQVRAESSRDQLSNKKDAIEKLVDLIMTHLIDPKKRVKTKVPFSAKVKRRTFKEKRSVVKKMRQSKDY